MKDGSRVLFWHDVWCGDRPLKTLFPDLFRMACLNYAMVQVVSWNGDISRWNLTFVRNLNDWKEDMICNLLAVLAGKEVLSQGKDEIVWPLDSKGSFSVKRFCFTHFDALDGRDFAAKSIWKSKAPTKVCFFAWQPPWARSLRMTCLKEEILEVQVDAPCVWRKKKLWIISLYIVDGFLRFGI